MRRIERASTFDKTLRKLSRKHPELEETVQQALASNASARKPAGDQIPRLDGRPVFKERLPLGDRGKRGGARLFYYCDDDLVLALFVIVKSEQSDVTPEEINKVLAEYTSSPDPDA